MKAVHHEVAVLIGDIGRYLLTLRVTPVIYIDIFYYALA